MTSPRRIVAGVAAVVTVAVAIPLGATTAGATELSPASHRLLSPTAVAFDRAAHSAPAAPGTGAQPFSLGEGADAGEPNCPEVLAASGYGAQGGYGTVAQAAMAGLAGGAAGGAVNGATTGGDVNSMIAGAAAGGLAGMAAAAAAQAANNAAAPNVATHAFVNDDRAFD